MDYRVDHDDRVMTTIRYQTFENSIPGIQASGRAAQGGALTFDNVAAYTQQLLAQNQKRLGKEHKSLIKRKVTQFNLTTVLPLSLNNLSRLRFGLRITNHAAYAKRNARSGMIG